MSIKVNIKPKCPFVYLLLVGLIGTGISIFYVSCMNTPENKGHKNTKINTMTAEQILGNSEYLACSYGGYRKMSRDTQPTIQELKNDMKILSAMDIKVIRTYNTKLKQATNLLQAIHELKQENPTFEMYVMLGAWIDCQNAWTDQTPNHYEESLEANAAEIERAVNLANKYPDIVKIIAVGNEAMVKWATSYFVQPNIILKWVNHLQHLKKEGKLDQDLWITSSDNFASWGGGDTLYHCEDLEKLIKAVDYVSMHTYPMHDTHHQPDFWGITEDEQKLEKTAAIAMAMTRAQNYAEKQYADTKRYIHTIDSTKEIHIGETGWSSVSTGFFGREGSRACDEYKEGIYYKNMRRWTNEAGISCFYFSAFNENWKDPQNKGGSENHFGLFKINGEAKYAVWDMVDQNRFNGLTRNGNTIKKTYNGDLNALLNDVDFPPQKQLNP